MKTQVPARSAGILRITPAASATYQQIGDAYGQFYFVLLAWLHVS